MNEPCKNCKFGFGWDFEPELGWVACADCNDEGDKPKPVFRDWLNSIVFYSVFDALDQFGFRRLQ